MKNAYYFQFKANSVSSLKNGVIEVVWVALVVVLQSMKEIQEIEHECHQQSINCCRKPARAKDLHVLGDTI